MLPVDSFTYLEQRCNELQRKYLDPIIEAEVFAVNNGHAIHVPDFDAIAAFRLLTHAELEGYFERKAGAQLEFLDRQFKQGNALTGAFASLIFLYLLKKQYVMRWSAAGLKNDTDIRLAENADMKNLAQEALGYGRQFIAANNGIKEPSIQMLSALMGFFSDELDDVLVRELDRYGKKRGDVAHDSWGRNTRTFESADIEKRRLQTILDLTKAFYETRPPRPAVAVSAWRFFWLQILSRLKVIRA